MGEKNAGNGENKQKKRRELFLIAGVLVTALACGIFWQVVHRASGIWVVVEVNGTEQARYALTEERTVLIEGYNGGRNTLVITGGGAYVTDASCPDHICEKQGVIGGNGESITCLPNRVVVMIRSDSAPSFDGLAR